MIYVLLIISLLKWERSGLKREWEGDKEREERWRSDRSQWPRSHPQYAFTSVIASHLDQLGLRTRTTIAIAPHPQCQPAYLRGAVTRRDNACFGLVRASFASRERRAHLFYNQSSKLLAREEIVWRTYFLVLRHTQNYLTVLNLQPPLSQDLHFSIISFFQLASPRYAP